MKKLLLSSVLCSISTAAIAHDHNFDLNKRFGFGGGVGFALPIWGNDFDDASKQNIGYNLHGRYNLSSADSLSLGINRSDFKDGLGFSTNKHVTVYDVLFLHRHNAKARFSPIYGAGAGVADFSDIDPIDNLKFALKVRLGAEYALTHNLYASVTVDYQYINDMPGSSSDYNDIDTHFLKPQANLTWYFGQGEEKAAPAVEKAPVAAAIADKDTDGDGVMDKKDKCPSTTAGKSVNAYGCEAKEKVSIRVRVLFASGSTSVGPGSDSEIAELAQFLNEHSNTKAEIQGHTDSTGSPAKNKILSQARADAVKNALITKHNIPAERVNSVGFGSAQPVADNKTIEGRHDNRRVMAIISE